MTVRELIAVLRTMPEDAPIFRKDSEWGPQPIDAPELTKLRNNPGDSYHWEWEDWNEGEEPGENTWIEAVLIGGYGRE
jgi:hypothetical protein